jgi:phage terminase small subunit
VLALLEQPTKYNNVDLTTLSEKHKAFAEEYVIDMNAMRSAKAVGYSSRQAYRILAREDVQAYLDWLNDSMRSDRVARKHEVMERLTKIARGDTKEEVVLPDGRSIAKDTLIKDRTKALELLGKHYKLFTDVQEIKTETVFNIGFSPEEEDEEE